MFLSVGYTIKYCYYPCALPENNKKKTKKDKKTSENKRRPHL